MPAQSRTVNIPFQFVRSDDEYCRRAFAAYYRHCRLHGLPPIQPAGGGDHVILDDVHYVAFSNIRGTYAVWEIKPSDRLYRLSKWPVELNDW